jgi:hypothetical protein
VQGGSNAWWSRLLIRNPPGPVASMEWRSDTGDAGGAIPYAADPENTFEVPAALLQSTAATVRIALHFTDGTSAAVSLAPADLAAPGSFPL